MHAAEKEKGVEDLLSIFLTFRDIATSGPHRYIFL